MVSTDRRAGQASRPLTLVIHSSRIHLLEATNVFFSVFSGFTFSFSFATLADSVGLLAQRIGFDCNKCQERKLKIILKVNI